MNFSCLHPRDQIVATMERIYRRNMTTTSGGNISIHDENDDKWMTLRSSPQKADQIASFRLEVLEATAAAIIQGRPLGPISPMSDEVTRNLLAALPGL